MDVRKNLLFNIINNISSILFPIITVPYVSRVLGVENIGIVGFSSTFSGYFCIIANMGIAIYGSREIAKLRDNKILRDKLFSELFKILLYSSSVSSLIYLFSIFLTPSLFNNREFLIISGLTLYLSAFSLDWFFTGRENFKMIAVRSIVIKIVCLILMFLFVKGKSDALIYCGIVVLSTILNNIWNFFVIIRNEVVISFNNINIKQHVKPLSLLLSMNIATSVYTSLDTILLGFMMNYTEVGLYSSAVKISRLLLPFAVATTSVMVPKIAYSYAMKDKLELDNILDKSFSLVTFFSIPMSIGLFTISPSFVPIFFGEEYLKVIPLLQILSSVLFFVGLSNFFGIQVLATTGKESKLLLSILLGAMVNLLLNIILIPRLGALGTSLTAAIAEFVVLISTFIFSYKYFELKLNWISILHSILSCLPLVIAYIFIPSNLSLQLLIVFIIYGVVTYLFMQSKVFKNQIALELIKRMSNIILFK